MEFGALKPLKAWLDEQFDHTLLLDTSDPLIPQFRDIEARGGARLNLLPDVSCDFTQVRLEQVGPDRVRVSGARGLAPGPAYKVSSTYMDGFRCTAKLTIVGIDATRKAA